MNDICLIHACEMDYDMPSGFHLCLECEQESKPENTAMECDMEKDCTQVEMTKEIKCRGCRGTGIAGALQPNFSSHRDPGQSGFGQTCPLCGGDGYYTPDARYIERGINLNEQ